MSIFEIYREELHKAVAAYPEEYGFMATTVDAVADKMIAAMKTGSYNKDGRAFKATAKRLGIKYTYTALNAAIKAALA